MAAALVVDFSSWLKNKLQELETDEGVFGSYIQSILDSDDNIEEKNEALQGIMSEIVQNEIDILKLCSEILEKWQFYQPKKAPLKIITNDDVDTKLVKLMESQTLATTKQKKYTEEEKKIREAILSQYAQMTDDEDDLSNKGDDIKENCFDKNTNAQAVMQAEKNKREQAKLDSQRKKEKDKEDREKQKQQREDKKEKRKTQKQERRR